MGRYVARRLLQMVPVLVGAIVLMYLALFQLPGDPAQALVGERAVRPEFREAINERYGLDQPLHIQIGRYIRSIATLDFGESFSQRRPVIDVIKDRAPVSFRLGLAGMFFLLLLGLTGGVISAVKRYGALDATVTLSAIVLVSIPVFVLGLLLQLFALRTKDLFGIPVTGLQEGLKSYVMPGFVLASVSMAYLSRVQRTTMIETMDADYVRTARAKGLSERRVIMHHAWRTSLIPVVTFIGVDFGTFLGGAILTETVFNINGLGRTIETAIAQQDNPVVLGVALFTVIGFLLVNLIVDVAYAWLDPRIRYR